jgi:hypothetical protein
MKRRPVSDYSTTKNKTMKHIPMLFILLVATASCHNGHQQPPTAGPQVLPKDTVHIYKADLLDSKKDPTCGMPFTRKKIIRYLRS